MKKLMLLSLFLFASIELSAQYTGTVVDAVRIEPIIGASVYLTLSGEGTETDLDGFFEIETPSPAENDTLIVSYLGYEELHIPVKKFKNRSIIYLKQLPIQSTGITIEAERIGFAVQEVPNSNQQLSAKQIDVSVSGDLKSVLRQIPSVQVVGNPVDGSYIQIRGSNPDEVRVFVDGFLINSLNFDNKADISVINTENIANMKVQKGGNSLIQGLGSAGGVVNIETKIPKKVTLSALAIKGEFDSERYSVNLGTPLSPKFSLKGYYTQSKVNPEMSYQLSTVDPSITDTYKILTQKRLGDITMYYTSSEGRLSLKYVYLEQADSKSDNDWDRTRTFSLLGMSYLGSLFGTDNWRVILNRNATNQKEQRLVPDTFNRFIYDYQSSQLNFRTQKLIRYKELKWTVAYEFFHDELSNSNEYFDGGQTHPLRIERTHDNLHSITTVMSMLDTTASTKNLIWNIYTSLRENFWVSGQSDYVTNFSVMLNRQLPNKRWEAHVTYGRNVKYPSLLQNAYAGNIANFTGQEFLDRLRPEYFSSFELGGYYLFRYPYPYVPRMKVEVSVFSTDIRNKIIQQPVDQGLILIQAGENTTTGFEAGVYAENIFSVFNANATATVLKISNHQSYPYKPDHLYRFNLQYVPENGPYSTLSVFYEGNAYTWNYTPDLILKTIRVDPFWDMDIAIGWKHKFTHFSFNAQFAVRNALDNSNYQDLYLKRRYLQASLAISY
jgi:outer membrane cobalamin receptor